jgi:hypothetical protein
MTTRTARQLLHNIDEMEADNLRRRLFSIDNQDGPIPAEHQAEAREILTPYLFNVMKAIAQTAIQNCNCDDLLLKELLAATSENFASL